MITVVGVDGDDTLWDNEGRFAMTQQQFRQILAPYHDEEWIDKRLLATEQKNLKIFGYGSKGFALSMIETAIELTEGRISGREIQQILDAVVKLLTTPIAPLDGVVETLELLKRSCQLILITKGDLFEQENKIAASGMDTKFHEIEIVSEKTPGTYARILEKYEVRPDEFLMIGNSMRSDVLPVVEIGGYAVHIPYRITWEHEKVDSPPEHPRYTTLQHISEVPGHLKALQRTYG